MAEANISVNKQTVLQLLKSGQEVPFLIPEYQRPYSWSDDEIITLFDDIWGFSIDRTQPNGAKSYFLGCVVSYKENGVRQIIDGQQRITSLTLLLIYLYHAIGVAKGAILQNMIFSDSYGEKSFNIQVPERKDCLDGLYNNNEYTPKDTDEERSLKSDG